MADYLRAWIPGGTYFFTHALQDRRARLLTDDVALLREAVARSKRERPFRIDAMVVLPDHLHAVWTLPAGDWDYSTRWAAIKAQFTMAVRGGQGCRPVDQDTLARERRAGLKPGLRAAKRECGVWQRRFWEHVIRDERDLRAHIRYCWSNPVKHGLVARPADWPHSSIHRDIRLGRVDPGWSDAGPEGAFGEP